MPTPDTEGAANPERKTAKPGRCSTNVRAENYNVVSEPQSRERHHANLRVPACTALLLHLTAGAVLAQTLTLPPRRPNGCGATAS